MAKVLTVTLMMRHPGYHIDEPVVATFVGSYMDESYFQVKGKAHLDDARRYASHVVHTIKESGDMWMEPKTLFDLSVQLDDGTQHLIPGLNAIMNKATGMNAVSMLGDLNGILQGLATLFGEWDTQLNKQNGTTNV